MKATMFFIRGFLVGVALAVPKGPAGFLAINQAVLYGMGHGMLMASGPIVTTALSCGVILFVERFRSSLTFIQKLLDKKLAHVISAIMLVCIGVVIFYMEMKTDMQMTALGTLWVSFKLLCFTTIEPMLVPMTLYFFLKAAPTIFTENKSIKKIFYIGIISGSTITYELLSGLFSELSFRDPDQVMELARRMFGGIFIAGGIIFLIKNLYQKNLKTRHP